MTLSDQDFLGFDAGQFRDLLARGTLTITALISRTLQQIERHDKHGLNLNAIVSLAPESLLRERARLLDGELRAGRSRGPLHGIPVVLKDCIATGPELGMTTSAGSFALLEGKITKNAPLVDRLLASGAVIVGKSNLSELCSFKGEGLIDGYSPVGGQTISPYMSTCIELDEGDLSPSSPGGSSTGSAVSVSAGFSLIGIGTENCGSIVQPSSRQALYSLKLGRGIACAEGCWRASKTLDTIGAMARSARDLAAASEILLDLDAGSRLLEEGGYASFLTGSVEGLRIGFVDPTLWRLPLDFWNPTEEAKNQHVGIQVTFRRLFCVRLYGSKITYPLTIPQPSELNVGDDDAPFVVNLFESAETAKEFFEDYVDAELFIRSLKDMVDFNKCRLERCLPESAPDQSWLIKAIDEKPSPERYVATRNHMLRVGRDGLAKVFRDNDLDLVIAPMDSSACVLSTASGYPIANVPLGRYHLKGQLSRPFGLAVLAPSEQEGSIFRFMSAYEASFPARPVPERLVNGAVTL
ncbi:amidase signature domain-containing protein [Podospora aff. communis PSN243]|uniref:Amidase signature domain-containing protein n=1 Tax=Podospora aff. communis PSN243 TaxID=3040156 RepID=A0AAV9GHH7_9PEZI|nr:amidase signature domain-containing protein [Podospora aff. communis PSN243]